jgi:hypothetical protein
MGTSNLAPQSHSSTALNAETNPALTVPVCHNVLLNQTTAGSQRSLVDVEKFEDPGTAVTYVAELVEAFPQFNLLQLISSPKKKPHGQELGAGLIDERSIILQQWDGVVLFRNKTKFTARLYEGYQDFPVKRAEIEIEEVADEQREMILSGAPFSWIIGYRVRAGTRSRFSEIYFRRLPPWTKKEIEEAELAAIKLDEEAGWTDPRESASD